MNMRMNLTGLADLANAQLANKGKPLELPLNDVFPDPKNPRNVGDDSTPAAIEAQEELDADVAERGVKTPISVRPHPTISGKYFINYGHRRYRSACRNSLPTIPAFVDEQFDSYDQVNENELRTGLTTRARALFIRNRLEAGDTKGEIAKRMRKKNQNFITEHLALIDAPNCVNQAYANGVTSARTLYELRQAWEQCPDQIDAWCRDVLRITRETIKDALAGFRHDEKMATDVKERQASEPSAPTFRHDEMRASPALQQPAAAPPSRRGSEAQKVTERPEATLARAKTSSTAGDIIVQYKGKNARIASNATVVIIIDGQDAAVEVPLSDIVFKR
jgi:ParB family chromosome partitioning protein